MDSLERVNAWLAAERRLGRDDGQPRDEIVSLLEDRRDALEEHGERPDLLNVDSLTELPDRFQPAARPDPDDIETVVTWNGDDERSLGATQKINNGLSNS
ncbi:MAG: hypothetical protein ABEI57_05710 [Halapricum sp.]